jgi:hypothetical protein
VLIRKGEEWLPSETTVGPFGGEGAAGRAVAELEARTTLAVSESLEVRVYRDGSPEGAVRTLAGESVWLVEAE